MILQGMDSEEQKMFHARPPDFQINLTSKPAEIHQRQGVSQQSGMVSIYSTKGNLSHLQGPTSWEFTLCL